MPNSLLSKFNGLIEKHSNPSETLRNFQITLGITMLILHFGSVSIFNAQMSHPVFSDNTLISNSFFNSILYISKYLIIPTSCLIIYRGGFYISIILFLLHSFLSYFDYNLVSESWNFNSHLIYFCFISILYERYKNDNSLDRDKKLSLLISSCLIIIGLIYFQAFLAKLLNSGIKWYLTGETIHYYILESGTQFGKFLAQHSIFKTFSGLATLLFEGSVIFLILSYRCRFYIGIIGIFFHLMIWTTMGISFWHLWIFFPVLLLNFKFRKYDEQLTN